MRWRTRRGPSRGKARARTLRLSVDASAPRRREESPAMKPSVPVVDDEPNIVVSLEFLMKQAGYDARIARNGEEALKALEERAPDLTLLDVLMPKRNGYDVCQTVRADARWAEVRIIMLTAKGRDVEREKGLALGADDYITKPFSTREVMERVKQYLDAADD
jgi:DNA-binding response OmpR family regulator